MRWPNNKLIRLPVWLAIALLVTACSFKTVYNRLDYFIVEYVEGLVTLDETLEADLESRASALMAWHRSTQLQAYAGWFRELQDDVGPTLTAAEFDYHDKKLESFWRDLYARLNTDMAGFLPGLNSTQRAELYQSLEEKNEDYLEDYIEIDDEERRDNRLERLQETYEDWLGELTDEQLSAIENTASAMSSAASRRFELRLQWQQRIREILESDLAPAEKTRNLQTFFDGFDMTRDPEVMASMEHNRQLLQQLTLQIAHSMTRSQKQAFIDRTDDYITMFTELAENR